MFCIKTVEHSLPFCLYYKNFCFYFKKFSVRMRNFAALVSLCLR